jgi:adenosine deaminase
VTAQQRAFFRQIPKVELHCHPLGAMREETFLDLARIHNAPVPADMVAGSTPGGASRWACSMRCA